MSSGKILPINVPSGNGLDNTGASIVGDITTLDYTPTTPADWTVPPANAQDALDNIAAQVTAIVPGTVTVDPAGPLVNPMAGLNINIGNGLQLQTTANGIDSFTSLMLHLDNNFTDSSQYIQTVSTALGSGSYGAGEFSQARETTNGAYPYVANQPVEFDFASGDFTIDMWAKSNGALNANGYLATAGIAGVSQDWAWRVAADGTIIWDNPGTFQSAAGAFITDGNYHHYALVRNGSTLTMYVDGGSVASVSYGGAVAYTNTNAISFGGVVGGGDQQGNLVSFIDEVRVSKGVARWTTNFTPPVAPYSADIVDLLGDVVTEEYTPTTPADWTVVPTTTQEALDNIAAQVTALPAVLTPNLETFVLAAPDIANGYVELAHPSNHAVTTVILEGAVPLIQGVGYDFTLTEPVTNTRITFSGTIIAGLTVGQKVQVNYWY